MGRLVMLPFSVGCVSQGSVAVIEKRPKKDQNEPELVCEEGDGCDQVQTSRWRKSSSGFLQLPRTNISAALQRLAKGFKNISNLFTAYKADDDDEYLEMKIGYPTDVQHVAHIGLDGFNDVGDMKSSDKAREFPRLSSLSLKQFELALASQAESNVNQLDRGPL